MSCGKAREIDLAAYLVDPDQPEWAAFREHYPTCPDCAEEVAAWTCIEASLRSAGDPVEEAHPAAALLTRFGEDPRALTPEEWQRVDNHTRDCRQCADELAALREFDFSALESASPPSVGEALRALGRSAGGLLRSLARRVVPPLAETAAGGLFGTREPDLVFQSREDASAGSRPAKGAPLAVLVAIEGNAAGDVFPVSAGENRIGRAKTCEIRVPSESLARVEASIRADSEALEITALHARRPVLVNGEAVRSGPLRDGDLVQIGSERFQIRRVTSE